MKTQTCSRESCQNPLPKRNKKYCCKQCKDNSDPRRWTIDEEIWLRDHFSNYPRRELVTSFLRWGNRLGYPKRTTAQTISRIGRLGLTTPATDYYLSLSKTAVARVLGIPKSRVPKLVKAGLPVRRNNRIATEDAIAWLGRPENRVLHGHLLKGASEKGLIYWLGPELAEEIARSPQQARMKSPVALKVNGVRYSSISEAARKCYCSRATLEKAIKRGRRKVLSMTIELVD